MTGGIFLLYLKRSIIILIIPVLSFIFFPSSNANAAQFNDTDNHWAKSYIDYMANNGYISGYQDGSFRPDNSITRVEFLSILLNCMQTKPAYNAIYTANNYWASSILDEAIRQGILNPAEYPYEINPHELLTRGEASAFVARALNIAPDYGQIYFRDIEKINSNPYKAYITSVYAKGIISGYPSGELKPYEKITRAQAAVILKKFCDKYFLITTSSSNSNYYNNKKITVLYFNGYKYNPSYIHLYIDRQYTSYTVSDIEIIDEYNFYMSGKRYNLNTERIGISLNDGVYLVKKINISGTNNTLLIDSSPYKTSDYWQNITLDEVYAVYDDEGAKIPSDNLSYLKFRIVGRSTIYDLDEVKINPEENYIEISGKEYPIKEIKIILKKKYYSTEYEYQLKDVYTRNNQLVFDCY